MTRKDWNDKCIAAVFRAALANVSVGRVMAG